MTHQGTGEVTPLDIDNGVYCFDLWVEDGAAKRVELGFCPAGDSLKCTETTQQEPVRPRSKSKAEKAGLPKKVRFADDAEVEALSKDIGGFTKEEAEHSTTIPVDVEHSTKMFAGQIKILKRGQSQRTC